MFSTMKMHAVWISVLAIVLFAIARPLSSQIIEMREYKGKTISCALSGLRGWGEPCGSDENYAFIFAGTVLSTTDISDTEKTLQLAPHEMFRGAPTTQLTVTTEQGACLPEIHAGEEWLFYLRRDEKSQALVLAYGSPSKPIADAQEDISTLRRTSAMADSGLIMGTVYHYVREDSDGMKSSNWEPVANHRVTATRKPDGVEYSAISDADGHYEFDPLPLGSYRITANTQAGLWAEDGPTEIRPHSCTAYQFELHIDGRISGHIRATDGKPFTVHPWVDIVAEDGSHSESRYVDDEGHFEVQGLEPGRYIVGVGINAQPNSTEWRARIYYPGVKSKEEARIVELGTAERRSGVDFKIPPPAGSQ